MRRNALTILQKFFGKGSFFFTLNLQREVDGKLVFIDNYLTLLDAFEADPSLKRQYYDGEIVVQYVAEYSIGDKNIIVAVGDTREDCYKAIIKNYTLA